MQKIQIISTDPDSRKLLRAAGVKRIHPGWYTLFYRGVRPDSSCVCGAKRNKKGELKINQNPPRQNPGSL